MRAFEYEVLFLSRLKKKIFEILVRIATANYASYFIISVLPNWPTLIKTRIIKIAETRHLDFVWIAAWKVWIVC
jgi:hypothetical protein